MPMHHEAPPFPLPFTGERFEALREDYLRMEALAVIDHTQAGILIIKLNGASKWLPRAWVRIERAPRGGRYLLVKYPRWCD